MSIPQRKLTILFPPGDVLTSVLFEKEKDTKIEDLLIRLCTLRGLTRDDLKVLNDTGGKQDTSLSVGEADSMFMELVDKKEKKEEKVEKKKKDEDDDEGKGKLREGAPPGIVITLGKSCIYGLREQLFPEEWQALQDLKTNYEICKNYSDEFLVSCLFSRKLDLIRTNTLLQNNWKWRKENNLVNLPKYSDFSQNMLKFWMSVSGARSKNGAGLTYSKIRNLVINQEPFTIPTMTKWITWMYTIGVFREGMDYLRNGLIVIQDMDGYGWKHFDIDFQKKMSSMWQDVFPMRVKAMYILNPPGIFDAVMKIAKTFNKSKIMDRIEILAKKDLTRFIDKTQLLEDFGGELTMDADAREADLKEWLKVNEERLLAPGRESN